MNKEQAKKWADVVSILANDKEIQRLNRNTGLWVDTDDIDLKSEPQFYREKPVITEMSKSAYIRLIKLAQDIEQNNIEIISHCFEHAGGDKTDLLFTFKVVR